MSYKLTAWDHENWVILSREEVRWNWCCFEMRSHQLQGFCCHSGILWTEAVLHSSPWILGKVIPCALLWSVIAVMHCSTWALLASLDDCKGTYKARVAFASKNLTMKSEIQQRLRSMIQKGAVNIALRGGTHTGAEVKGDWACLSLVSRGKQDMGVRILSMQYFIMIDDLLSSTGC